MIRHLTMKIFTPPERQIVDIALEQIKPDPTGVFQTQGIPTGTIPPPRVLALYHEAETVFYHLAAPKGIISGIPVAEFAGIYEGNGKNEPETPLEMIFPKADYLALFAFTLGAAVSREIERQAENKNLALGYMLDAVASYSADKASRAGQEFFYNHLHAMGLIPAATRVLLYSPGYCGWHVSGQHALFDRLEPGEIDIHLNKSFLMSPLKSISGVLVAGNPEIHRFKNNYPFCAQCRTRNCRSRSS